MTTFIYILQNPVTLETKYIGKSNNPKKDFLTIVLLDINQIIKQVIG